MNPHSHSGVTHTVQGLEIMHKSKQDHTTFSSLNVFCGYRLPSNWAPDEHLLCQNVLYCYKRWCSKKVVNTMSYNYMVWFILGSTGILIQLKANLLHWKIVK